MNALRVTIRCTIGCILGSSLGVAMIIAGCIQQGIGLAIVGGVLGVVLAISSVLYRTTASEAFGRGLLLFLRWTAHKNIPGGEALVPIQDKDIPGRQPQTADPVALDNRMLLGMKLGAALAAVPAVLVAVYIQDANLAPEPMVLEVVKRVIIGFSFIAFVGGGCGAALGAVTMPGIHRRNIALGTILGATAGAGVAIAVAPARRSCMAECSASLVVHSVGLE